MEYNRYRDSNKYSSSDRFRVRSPIRSFRDLEVYQKTIQLSNEITGLEFLSKDGFEDEKKEIKEVAEKIPKLIAESYGDKFDSRELACKKLTLAVTLITNIITRIDILRERLFDDRVIKDVLDGLLSKYQTQKRKVLNLRKAWQRVFGGDKK